VEAAHKAEAVYREVLGRLAQTPVYTEELRWEVGLREREHEQALWQLMFAASDLVLAAERRPEAVAHG
jgi:hypothetical protein